MNKDACMRIYSYFARLRSEYQRFQYDRWRVIASLRYRPNNWISRSPHYSLHNHIEDMTVWIGNRTYGLDFQIGGRKYGGVTMWSMFEIPFGWRRQMLNQGRETLVRIKLNEPH